MIGGPGAGEELRHPTRRRAAGPVTESTTPGNPAFRLTQAPIHGEIPSLRLPLFRKVDLRTARRGRLEMYVVTAVERR